MSTYDKAGKKLEDSIDLTLIALQKSPFIWWEQSYHMKTPLENLDQGSYILIQLFALSSGIAKKTVSNGESSETSVGSAKSSSHNVVSWSRIDLDLQTVDASEIRVDMKVSTIPSENHDIANAVSNNSCIVIDTSITKKLAPFSLDQIRTLSSNYA